jgi:hypothetical protein
MQLQVQGPVPLTVDDRTIICATLSPSGGDDSAAIQAKIDRCPANQVVMLNPGIFTVNNYLLIHSPITLRGSGAGKTIRVAPQPSVQLAQTHARRRAAGGAGRRGFGWHETADLEDRQAVEQPDRSVAAYIAPEQVVVAVPLKSRCPTPTSPVTRRNRRPAESCRRS